MKERLQSWRDTEAAVTAEAHHSACETSKHLSVKDCASALRQLAFLVDPRLDELCDDSNSNF
jgi:hypothetical protein